MSKEFVEAVSSTITNAFGNNAEDSPLAIYSMEISTPLPADCTNMQPLQNKHLSYLGSLESDFISISEEDSFNECNVNRWYFIGKEVSDDGSKQPLCFVGSVVSDDGMYSWQFDQSQQKVVLILVEDDNGCCPHSPSLFYFKPQQFNLFTISPFKSLAVGNTTLSECIQWNTEVKEFGSLKTAGGMLSQFAISGLPQSSN